MPSKTNMYLILYIQWLKKNFKLIAEIVELLKSKSSKKMILAAKNSGADFVKFQIWNPDNLKVEVGIKTGDVKFTKSLF